MIQEDCSNGETSCEVRFQLLEKQQKHLLEQVCVLNRAMFGEELTKQKGIVEMTSEMYATIILAKGSKTFLIALASMFSAVLTIWTVIKVFK